MAFNMQSHVGTEPSGIVLNLKTYDTVTPYLIKLHRLPVRQRIMYKLNLIVFKA